MTDWEKVAEEIKLLDGDLAQALYNIDHNARVAGYLLGKVNGLREAAQIAKPQEILSLADKIEKGEA
jgi:hypothetical protein